MGAEIYMLEVVIVLLQPDCSQCQNWYWFLTLGLGSVKNLPAEYESAAPQSMSPSSEYEVLVFLIQCLCTILSLSSDDLGDLKEKGCDDYRLDGGGAWCFQESKREGKDLPLMHYMQLDLGANMRHSLHSNSKAS